MRVSGTGVYLIPLAVLGNLDSGPRHAGGFSLTNEYRITRILPDAMGIVDRTPLWTLH